MNKYLFIVSRSILATLGYGERILVPIEVECPSNEEAIRHADTLRKRGDEIFAIFDTDNNIWERYLKS